MNIEQLRGLHFSKIKSKKETTKKYYSHTFTERQYGGFQRAISRDFNNLTHVGEI